jgi:hypothetical protein
VGLIAAAGYAILPTALIYTVDLLSEPLGTFWFLLYILASLTFAEHQTWGRAAAAGLMLGLATLTRPNCLFMMPLAGLWALVQFRCRWLASMQAMAIPLIALLTLTPWTVRNYLVFERFIPLATSGGSGLLQGNNRIVATTPELYGYSVWDTEIPEYRDALRAAGNEYERDQLAKRLAMQWLAENPERWAYLAGAKFLRSWTPFLASKSPRTYRLVLLVTWSPVLVLFAVAFFPTLVFALRSGNPLWILHLAVFHYIITSLIFYGLLRYRQPIEPLCLILASKTLECLGSRIVSRSSRAFGRQDGRDQALGKDR